MVKAIKIGGGLALIIIAWLLHVFYVSYRLNAQNYIFSWNASNAEYEKFVQGYSKKFATPDSYKISYEPSGEIRFELRKQFIRQNCSAFQGANLSKFDRFFALSNPDYYLCRKKWIEPKVVARKELVKGRSADEVAASFKRNYPFIRKGMVPSEVSAGDNPSRSGTARSLWLGIILPLALLVSGLIMLLMGLVRRRRVLATQDDSERLEQPQRQAVPLEAGDSERYQPREQRESPLTLGEVLKQHFGKGLGVAGGSAKRDDPLVITETVDYVSIEYAVAKFLMQGQEYKKEKQQLLNLNGRRVDELVFVTKSFGASDWETTRHFYFDITDGFSRLGK